jgi:hypothetical protein
MPSASAAPEAKDAALVSTILSSAARRPWRDHAFRVLAPKKEAGADRPRARRGPRLLRFFAGRFRLERGVVDNGERSVTRAGEAKRSTPDARGQSRRRRGSRSAMRLRVAVTPGTRERNRPPATVALCALGASGSELRAL